MKKRPQTEMRHLEPWATLVERRLGWITRANNTGGAEVTAGKATMFSGETKETQCYLLGIIDAMMADPTKKLA